MKVIHMKDGGVIVEPETDEEKRLHEIGVAACLEAIAEESTDEEMARHVEHGADPGDFRDLGLEEAYDAMERASGSTALDPDAINGVCCDKRVEEALNRFFEELTRQERKR